MHAGSLNENLGNSQQIQPFQPSFTTSMFKRGPCIRFLAVPYGMKRVRPWIRAKENFIPMRAIQSLILFRYDNRSTLQIFGSLWKSSLVDLSCWTKKSTEKPLFVVLARHSEKTSIRSNYLIYICFLRISRISSTFPRFTAFVYSLYKNIFW